MPTDRTQDTEAIRAASELIERLDRWATWTPPEAAGEKKLLLDTAACVARLVARLEAAEEQRRLGFLFLTDALEETGCTDDELLAERGTFYTRLLSARAALAAAAPGETTLTEPGDTEGSAAERPSWEPGSASAAAARCACGDLIDDHPTRACGFWRAPAADELQANAKERQTLGAPNPSAAPGETEQTP